MSVVCGYAYTLLLLFFVAFENNLQLLSHAFIVSDFVSVIRTPLQASNVAVVQNGATLHALQWEIPITAVFYF